MTIKNVGRFVVSVELDRVDGAMKYFDAVLSKDGREVKICKGCIGQKSGEFWGEYLEKLAKKLELLYARLDMVSHNMLCYSATYMMESPKEGYEKEWQEAKDEAEFVEQWIAELLK